MKPFRSTWRSSILACTLLISAFFGFGASAFASSSAFPGAHTTHAVLHYVDTVAVALSTSQVALAPVAKPADMLGANMVRTSSHKPGKAMRIAYMKHDQTPGASALGIDAGSSPPALSERL